MDVTSLRLYAVVGFGISCGEPLGSAATLLNLRFVLDFKEDKMGRACITYGEEEECIQDFGGKARRKETTRKI
jgi:hypothetical protein